MALPQTYLISYLAFGGTHLLVNKIMQYVQPPARQTPFEDYLESKDLPPKQ